MSLFIIGPTWRAVAYCGQCVHAERNPYHGICRHPRAPRSPHPPYLTSVHDHAPDWCPERVRPPRLTFDTPAPTAPEGDER